MKKKQEDLTPAQIIFKDKDILLQRPEYMPYEDYKTLRNTQGKVLQKLFAGPSNPKITSMMGLKFGYNQH